MSNEVIGQCMKDALLVDIFQFSKLKLAAARLSIMLHILLLLARVSAIKGIPPLLANS